jgi:hypothetical protein
VITLLPVVLLLIGLVSAIVVLHPRWKEGPLMRLGLGLVALTGLVMGPELMSGQAKDADALAFAWALQCLGLLCVLAGWAWRVMVRGNLQRRHTDHGTFDENPHHHARRAGEA